MRTDQISGIVTCVFGVLLIGFGLFALLIVALQRLMFSVLPPIPQDAMGVRFTSAMEAIHFVWLIYLPLMVAGGAVYVAAGWRLLRGSELARRVAQANALLGYVWLTAYAISCYQVIPLLPFDELPGPALEVLRWVSVIGGTLIGAAFPTGLLYVLSRNKAERQFRSKAVE